MTIVSNNISATAEKIVLSQQGFSYSLDKKYIDECRMYLDSLKTYLQQAKMLTEKYSSLGIFKNMVQNTEKTLTEYEANISMVETNAAKANENNMHIAQLKDKFSEQIKKYLELQNAFWHTRFTNMVLTVNNSDVDEMKRINKHYEKIYE